MKVRIKDLSKADLDRLPEWKNFPFSCKFCTYWEFPEEYRKDGRRGKNILLQKKKLWYQDSKRLFGNCGKVLCVDGKVVGYAQFAPPEFLPGISYYELNPPDYESILISCLYIPQREFRGKGYGTRLLEEIIIDLKHRGINSVETFARRGNPKNPSGPTEFYLKNGFTICCDDDEFPLLRIDLSVM
jgi:GNAT superfamily N-acetyltransferase